MDCWGGGRFGWRAGDSDPARAQTGERVFKGNGSGHGIQHGNPTVHVGLVVLKRLRLATETMPGR